MLLKRDIIFIPAIVILTLITLAVGAEMLARFLFKESQTSTMACLIANDRMTGVRAIPNTVCHQKIFESELVDYRFNDCGFRTPQSCAPAPAGTYRIVMIGSSISYGMHVQQRDSFAGLLGPALSARLHRPVDVFNQSMQWGVPASLALRTKAIVAPQPDMILWALTPFDIANVRLLLPYLPGQEVIQAPSIGKSTEKTASQPEPHGVLTIPGRAWRRMIAEVSDTRAVFMLRHFLYGSESQFLAHTLNKGAEIDYLRATPSPALRDNLADFALALDSVARTARAANVPLVVTLVPSRPQVIMLSNGHWDAGYDPNELGHRLAAIVTAHGGRYIDMTQGIERFPRAGQLFFPVDEHLPPEGQAMLSSFLTEALIRSDAIPAAAKAAQ